MTPDPSPEELYEILTDLSEKFDTKFAALAKSVNARLDKMQTEISDMRVRLAEAGVQAVRLETVEREIARVEKRAADDMQIALRYITQIRDELGIYQVDHAKTHETLHVTQATQTEVLRQLGGRWGTVRSIVIPLVVGVLASILTAALSGAL